VLRSPPPPLSRPSSCLSCLGLWPRTRSSQARRDDRRHPPFNWRVRRNPIPSLCLSYPRLRRRKTTKRKRVFLQCRVCRSRSLASQPSGRATRVLSLHQPSSACVRPQSVNRFQNHQQRQHCQRQ
jgi:hypothetical protein